MKKQGRVYLLIFPVCAVLIVAVQSLLVTFVQVKGNSMVPTYHDGQVLLVNRAAFGIRWPIIGDSALFWNPPRDGDVVVLRRPDTSRLVVKRVVATGGQELSVNSHQLQTASRLVSLSEAQEYWLSSVRKVPAESLLVVGDNAVDSEDSRDWGFVPLDNIIGAPWQ
ncbi:MAG: signal peptidase I [Spirochaetales bacterium]